MTANNVFSEAEIGSLMVGGDISNFDKKVTLFSFSYDEMMDAARALIASCDQRAKPNTLGGWISVSERLPEIIEDRPRSETGASLPVLVYLRGEDEPDASIDIWRLYRGGRGDTTSTYWDYDPATMTHWMPLPTPPDGQGQQQPAVRDVLAERHRQIHTEGWTPEHDDEHDAGALAAAACAYALYAADELHPQSQGDGNYSRNVPGLWPFELSWWKPNDPRRAMVKSAALILAEIDRMDRAAKAQRKDK